MPLLPPAAETAVWRDELKEKEDSGRAPVKELVVLSWPFVAAETGTASAAPLFFAKWISRARSQMEVHCAPALPCATP